MQNSKSIRQLIISLISFFPFPCSCAITHVTMEALRVSNKPNAREPQPLSEQGDRKTTSVASKPEKPVSEPISGNRNTETNAAKLLQSDVYRTVRANDRKAVIKTLQESFYLRNIPLNQKCGRDGTPLTTESAGQPQWGELETEVFKSNVILNGISLCGNNAKSAFCASEPCCHYDLKKHGLPFSIKFWHHLDIVP